MVHSTRVASGAMPLASPAGSWQSIRHVYSMPIDSPTHVPVCRPGRKSPQQSLVRPPWHLTTPDMFHMPPCTPASGASSEGEAALGGKTQKQREATWYASASSSLLSTVAVSSHGICPYAVPLATADVASWIWHPECIVAGCRAGASTCISVVLIISCCMPSKRPVCSVDDILHCCTLFRGMCCMHDGRMDAKPGVQGDGKSPLALGRSSICGAASSSSRRAAHTTGRGLLWGAVSVSQLHGCSSLMGSSCPCWGGERAPMGARPTYR
ncbi:hypothetical protein HaLaN_25457 [Haematococcus lacustris]|uniref:Uncharacterized protein n=1 Tax=Haematococcus lacustris TaxID=44745 RepID=A0A6A0A061_HAELA|nr:hypothetical protein HaLaN_25457 [Haematococcus lacustris]